MLDVPSGFTMSRILIIEDEAPMRTALADVLAEDSAAAQPRHVLAIRPEHMALHPPGTAGGEPCRVLEAAFGGARQTVLVEVAGQRITVEASAVDRLWQPDDAASLHFHPRTGRIFPAPALQ